MLPLGIGSSKSETFGQADKVMEMQPLGTCGNPKRATFGHEVPKSIDC